MQSKHMISVSKGLLSHFQIVLAICSIVYRVRLNILNVTKIVLLSFENNSGDKRNHGKLMSTLTVLLSEKEANGSSAVFSGSSSESLFIRLHEEVLFCSNDLFLSSILTSVFVLVKKCWSFSISLLQIFFSACPT